MKALCERMSAEMFPAVRALIAKELVDSLGFNQLETARKMGLTQPAISQYRNELRGVRVKVLKGNLKIFSRIQESARLIAKSRKRDNTKLSEEIMCSVCKEIRGQGL